MNVLGELSPLLGQESTLQFITPEILCLADDAVFRVSHYYCYNNIILTYYFIGDCICVCIYILCLTNDSKLREN